MFKTILLLFVPVLIVIIGIIVIYIDEILFRIKFFFFMRKLKLIFSGLAKATANIILEYYGWITKRTKEAK